MGKLTGNDYWDLDPSDPFLDDKMNQWIDKSEWDSYGNRVGKVSRYDSIKKQSDRLEHNRLKKEILEKSR